MTVLEDFDKLRRKFPVEGLPDRCVKTQTSEDISNHYQINFDLKQAPTEPNYVDKYKDGATRRLRGYWEVHAIPDYQMDDQGGPGLQGFTEVHSHRFKLYVRASLAGEAAEAVKNHELEHQLDPYASESEIRSRTNTTSSNPYFSYRVLWSY